MVIGVGVTTPSSLFMLALKFITIVVVMMPMMFLVVVVVVAFMTVASASTDPGRQTFFCR